MTKPLNLKCKITKLILIQTYIPNYINIVTVGLNAICRHSHLNKENCVCVGGSTRKWSKDDHPHAHFSYLNEVLMGSVTQNYTQTD